MRFLRYIFLAALFSLLFEMTAQTPVQMPDLSVPTKIAPEYFGPNAFPVPDMLDGATSKKWTVELYSDNYFSNIEHCERELTSSVFMRLKIPLFSPRVNLTVYGNVFEYFSTPESVNRYRRVDSSIGQNSGALMGDIYVSTDIMALTQQRHGVDMAIRAALKSASGGMYHYARYYDNAGYFFDATFGRTIFLPQPSSSLKFAVSGGFLCWQTDNGRQNDAVMYGVKAIYDIRNFSLSAEYSGYVGWEKDGDAPMVLRVDAAYEIKDFTINLGYQAGLMDYPFHRARVGLTYNFEL